MKKLSFTFVMSSFQLYGGVLYVLQCANRLVARGHRVQIFTPAGTVDPAVAARLHPSIIVTESKAVLPATDGPLHQKLKLFWSMATELPQADIVVATHTPTAAPVLFARLWLRLIRFYRLSLAGSLTQNKQALLHNRSTFAWLYQDYPEMFIDRRIEQLLLRFAPRYFDVIWAVSNPLRNAVAKHTNTTIVMAGNGLQMADLLLGHPRPKRDDEIQRVFYVGNSLPRKGLTEFLAAMNIVCQSNQSVQTVVAGGKDCQKLIEESELGAGNGQAAIEFHERPSDSELCELYASSDLFVSASWGEGLGYPPLEAMACGTPVVLTDSGGVRDYAQHEENCLMVESKDVPAMATAIRHLLENKELAARLAQSGKKTASRYDWKSVVDRIEASAYQLAAQP